MRSSMGRRPVGGNGDEQDAFTPWRKVYPYLERAGAVKAIKRQANKRDRRRAKQGIDQDRSI